MFPRRFTPDRSESRRRRRRRHCRFDVSSTPPLTALFHARTGVVPRGRAYRRRATCDDTNEMRRAAFRPDIRRRDSTGLDARRFLRFGDSAAVHFCVGPTSSEMASQDSRIGWCCSRCCLAVLLQKKNETRLSCLASRRRRRRWARDCDASVSRHGGALQGISESKSAKTFAAQSRERMEI